MDRKITGSSLCIISKRCEVWIHNISTLCLWLHKPGMGAALPPMSWECESCVSPGLNSRPGQHILDLCFSIGCGKWPCCSKETQRKPQFEGWLGPRQKTGKALLVPQQKGTRGWEGGTSDRQNTDCDLEGYGAARSGLSYLKDNTVERLNSGRFVFFFFLFFKFLPEKHSF